MPDRKILETILEDISLEFVLADISDPDSFSELLLLLKKFFQTAKDLKFSELAEDAKKAGKIVKKIMESKSPATSYDFTSKSLYDEPSHTSSDIENKMDSLNLIISEMKSFLHFITTQSHTSQLPEKSSSIFDSGPVINSEATVPDTTDDFAMNRFYIDHDAKKIKTEQVAKSEATIVQAESEIEIKPKPISSETNLLHPGKLPSFLNLEDFAEFLSLQKSTLDKMESLILDIEKNNNRAYAQGELKRLFHTTKGEAGFLGLQDVEKICHRAEDLMDTENFGDIVDLLLSVKDWLDNTYKIYNGNTGTAPSPDKIIKLFDNHKKEPVPFSDLTQSYAEEQEPSVVSPTSSIVAESINVDASRLDRMVNIIGELAIAESMVTQSPELGATNSSSLLRALNSLHKITRELQTLGLSLRMVPLKAIFKRMDRVVRDLAKKTDKKIQFIIKGEATELDKSIVDKLGDPLIHLVRNSVDHGIEENSNNRVEAGKPEVGTIELRAFHKGNNLFIEVEDDGKGINTQILKEKAISKGIIKDDKSKDDDDEILNLVFHPGLTTTNKITDVSGRGVGMDVVKKSIESCKGKVSITSIKGKGTTCTIKIPLTLSIIDGLVVRVVNETYIIPTLSVITSLKVNKQQISNVFEKGEMINVLGKLIPLFRLNRLFELNDSTEDIDSKIIVVVEDNGFNTALLVDELIGKQNTVIKNLGMGMEEIKGISGGTIMPDGRVSLILDIAGIIELSHMQ